MGTAYTWELNSKTLAPIIMIDQSKILRSDLLHSFLEVLNCVARFTAHGKLHKFGAKKPIAKPPHSDYFTINFSCLESHTEHGWRCS